MTLITLKYSFRYAGHCTNSTRDEVETEQKFDNDDDLTLIQQFNMAENFTENLQTYIEEDDCLLTKALLKDKQILDWVRKTEETE